MTELDRQLFLAINNGFNCSFNDLWIGYGTWLGFGWISYPIAVLALLALCKCESPMMRRTRMIGHAFWTNILTLAVSAIVAGIALYIIKNAVHAPRPLTVFASDISAGRVYVNVMFDKLYWNSFPSGHTQIAFTIATVLLWAYARAGKLKWRGIAIIVGIASLIGLSRIYVGAHFPSDVLGGAALGSLSALVCCFAVGRWEIKRAG